MAARGFDLAGGCGSLNPPIRVGHLSIVRAASGHLLLASVAGSFS